MKKQVLVLVLALTPVRAWAQASSAKLIDEALLPLPSSLQDRATVVLDAEPGKRAVLREGSNGLMCRANTSSSSFSVYCYPRAMDAFWTRLEQLTLEGKSSSQIRDLLSADAASGKLKTLAGVTVYRMRGESAESSLPLTAVFLPYATSESTGLLSERSYYRPWLMWAGTAFAHVMIPGK
jgi:hypothetical protein